MYIKKLELQGFKSFGDRTKIVFHPGITAVVGPNGTGKSNIVDALLWVMSGKRLKALRGERSGDIIFNGNAKTPPLNMADVSITIGEEEEDTVINHRLFRTGEGEYRLNGKAVRLKDIQDFLWKKAIGETEYFVIEQGSIGLFLSSKPQEKRFLLEEAAGTAFYKEKKRQAQQKLENSAQNLSRLEDIIVEVEKTQNALKRQAQAAIRYRKLRETIRELTLSLYRKKIHKLEESQRETIQYYQKSLCEEQNLIAELKSEEKKLAEKRREVWNLEKTSKDERETLYNLKSQSSRLDSEKDKEEKRIDYFDDACAKASENKAGLLEDIESLKEEIVQGESELHSLGGTLGSKKEELDAVGKVTKVSDRELGERQDRIEDLRGQLLRKLSIQTEIKNEASRFEKELELILRQEEKLKNQIGEEENLRAAKNEDIGKHKEELSENQKKFEEYTRIIEEDVKTRDSLSAALDILQNQIDQATKEKDNSLHHLNSLEKLLEKERSRDATEEIPGSLGLLADLIEADPENAFLVDVFWKEEAKASLISAEVFLKNLPGDRLKGDYLLISSKKAASFPSQLCQDPRVSGFLKAYVRPDPKIKDSLAQLEEAVIVNDVKAAVALWLDYPDINCLTRNGDLLLSSGLLRLGPKKEGLFVLNQEIKTLKEKIAHIDQKIGPLSAEWDEKSRNKSQMEDRIRQNSLLRTSFERAIAEKEREKKFSLAEKEKTEANIAVLKSELLALRDEKREKSDKLEKLREKIHLLENEEESLKEEVRGAEDGLSQLRGQREEKKTLYFELQSRVDILKEKINGIQGQILSLKRRIQQMETKISGLDEEMEKLGAQKIQAQKSAKELGNKASTLEREIQEKESKLSENESLLMQIQREQQEMEDRIEALRQAYESRKEERVQREIKKAQGDRDIANCEESCWQDLKKTLEEVKKEVPLESVLDIDVEYELADAKDKLEKLKTVNLMAEEEYLIQKERYDFLTSQRNDLRESIDTTQEAIRKIDQESRTQFLSALRDVNKHFKDVFSLLFEGGHAELRLSDSSDPLESGVEIIAQPPGKKVQSLSLLSGGEKTLTSLAFFFGLFRYKPTPFCILDEVDAALDEVNLSRFLNLMKKIKNQTQFILITHNFKSMEVADYIYGTTMGEPNITSILALKLEKNVPGSA